MYFLHRSVQTINSYLCVEGMLMSMCVGCKYWIATGALLQLSELSLHSSLWPHCGRSRNGETQPAPSV